MCRYVSPDNIFLRSVMVGSAPRLNPPIESSCHQFQHVLRDIWLEIRVFQSRILQWEAFLMFRRLRLWIKWHTVPPNRKPISFPVRHTATIS
jgi:hypothetical protein